MSLGGTGVPERARAREILLTPLRRQRWTFLGAGALLCLYQVAEASVPLLLGWIVDHVLEQRSVWAPLLSVAALGVAIFTVSWSWRTAFRFLQAATARRTEELRDEIATSVIASRPSRGEVNGDDLVTVAGEDAGHAADIMEILAVAASALVGILFCAGVLAYIDLALGAMVLGGTAAVLTVLHLISGRIASWGQEHQRLLAVATARVGDLLRGLRPLAGIGGRGAAYQGYRRLSSDAREQAEGLAKLGGVSEMVTTLTSTLLVGLVGVAAGYRALAGDISIGELITVVGLTQFVADPAQQLCRMPQYAAAARASARRLAAVGEPTPMVQGRDLPAAGEVAAIGAWNGEQKWSAPEGQLTVVYCSSGHAAEVVEALRAGVDAAPMQCHVQVRGVPTQEADLEQLRGLVLAEARHPQILQGTVGQALVPTGRFAGKETEPDEPSELCSRLRLDDVTVGSALEREVAERGIDLSGGQRQRLALGRALAADPDILVLVDPTSAVDAVTARSISLLLAEKRSGRTTVVLCAGPEWVTVADRVEHMSM
ncbi:ATP-binding cassette domain-containing protein [Dermatophilus congolensis]|uniref:ATP-binding cassette domain-containing protein n=1 Tax=Dermatophilus congolensis TaxID=1863 RepID=UPI001AAFA409|nr:ABC transporter ATP-binding protein [Dermatophilus congolensis]MBO3143522.1 ABC transporter ATP-binding protein [Dermatophilus congolensis]MBO3152513.1 ABC transporter ATP-binding protein [Dermatophilus congolensis]MBO3160476.1 ABC transporter ATP-binding protein [Dermatophilus congolensis]MBO3163799.1 ABC transporter ATP-binding protein [Dermatophilus congolensis]MBO3177345.1 ABC transporter ATP-binding protein [Dermatophilus congolensis]